MMLMGLPVHKLNLKPFSEHVPCLIFGAVTKYVVICSYMCDHMWQYMFALGIAQPWRKWDRNEGDTSMYMCSPGSLHPCKALASVQ